MLITDPIGDLLTRIRNGQKARKECIYAPVSKEREAVLKVLVEEGYLANFTREICPKTGHEMLRVVLKYVGDMGVIRTIKRVSKPGRRVYASVKKLTPVCNGLGISILSTSKGVISDVKAREISAGGEVLCSVF